MNPGEGDGPPIRVYTGSPYDRYRDSGGNLIPIEEDGEVVGYWQPDLTDAEFEAARTAGDEQAARAAERERGTADTNRRLGVSDPRSYDENVQAIVVGDGDEEWKRERLAALDRERDRLEDLRRSRREQADPDPTATLDPACAAGEAMPIPDGIPLDRNGRPIWDREWRAASLRMLQERCAPAEAAAAVTTRTPLAAGRVARPSSSRAVRRRRTGASPRRASSCGPPGSDDPSGSDSERPPASRAEAGARGRAPRPHRLAAALAGALALAALVRRLRRA